MTIRIFIILIALYILPITVQAQSNDIVAVKAAADEDFSKTATTQTGRTLHQWYKLRLSDRISFREAQLFLNTNKDWPRRSDIQKNAEHAITASVPTSEVIRFFQSNPPLTGNGMAHYLKALIAAGRTAQAMQTLKNWWPKAVLSPEDQSMILQQFGQYLGSQDHERRLRHIIHDKHYTASRQLAERLRGGYPQLVEAKIALIEQKSNAADMIARVPANLQNNEALMLARLQWHRKNDEDARAIDILSKAPAGNRMSDPRGWWLERHIMTRRLMGDGKWGTAYQLVKDHRQKEGFSFAQAEFLAGWIALRQVGKPWEGFQHFERLFNAVKSPISRSRGAYWAGLASETLGHPDIATQWYQVAAKYQTTFYGQMAAERINLPLGLLQETPFQITAQAEQNFRNQPLLKAARLLSRAEEHTDSKSFIIAAMNDDFSGLDYRLLADFAQSLGYRDTAVTVAKAAERQKFLMPTTLFPILPEAKTGRYAIHPAFNHGIMRQESLFNMQAQSHAGALGLMQLMPATARETARKAGLPYSKSRLTSDPDYNMILGSLYIKQMLDRYDSNRTLAIAAYNAGPGRVDRWLDEMGDPRDPAIDETDWIEQIPIYETRNYVHRVTEAINVYARLFQ